MVNWGRLEVGGVLRNQNGEVLYMFSKHLGIKDSNEAEMMAILEALCIYCDTFQFNHIVENDSINAISWARNTEGLERCNFSLMRFRFNFGMLYIFPAC